jgi:hypothetical protein
MRTDLVKLGVPVRAVSVSAKGKARDQILPFDIVIDESVGGLLPKTLAKQRFLVIAYAGRRISESGLNVESLEVRGLSGPKILTRTKVPVEIARAVASGAATPATVDALFK